VEPPAAAQRRGGTTLTPTSGIPPWAARKDPVTSGRIRAATEPWLPRPLVGVAASQKVVCCDHRQNPPPASGTPRVS
jgi:hypothetical protein